MTEVAKAKLKSTLYYLSLTKNHLHAAGVCCFSIVQIMETKLLTLDLKVYRSDKESCVRNTYEVYKGLKNDILGENQY